MTEDGTVSTDSPVYSSFADDDDFGELLEYFLTALPERRNLLEESRRVGNIEQLRTQAHQLKGAGGGYGFPGLSEAACRLEDACHQDNPDVIQQTFDRLIQYLDRIRV